MSVLMAVGLAGMVAIEVISISRGAHAKGYSIQSPATNASEAVVFHFKNLEMDVEQILQNEIYEANRWVDVADG